MKKVIIGVILFVVSLVIFSYHIGIIGFEFKGDENFYFQSSKRMVQENDWVTPYYFKNARFEKPVIYYWIIALLFKIFGIAWNIARFPSAIFMSGTVVLTYLFGLRLFDKKTALLSSIIAITTFATFRYARLALPESFSLFLLSATLYLLIFKKSYFLAYVFMGFAMMTKGPVGIILPLFILTAYKYGIGEKGVLKDIKFFPFFIITLLIGLPWFLMMAKIHGQTYLNHIFFRETVERIAGFEFKSLIYYVPVIFLYFLPYSILIVLSIKNAALAISERRPYEKGAALSLVWFLGILIFFTFIGEKHRHYMLLLSVPFALMVGNLFSDFIFKKKRVGAVIVLFIFVLFFLGFESAKLIAGNHIGGIARVILNSSYNINNIKKHDRVGIGSHTIVPQEVEAFLGHSVERYCYNWPPEMQEECDRENETALNKTLFGDGTDAYLVIKKRDFDKHIFPETRKALTILSKGYMYNKDVAPGHVFNALKSFRKQDFIDLFKEEVLFVTNKRGI